MSRRPNIEAIYPLTPMQHAMLLHTLRAPESGAYFEQLVVELDGVPDGDLFERAWQAMVDHQPALRTAFVWERRDKPLQIVVRHVRLPWVHVDWRGLDEDAQEQALEELLAQERRNPFAVERPPLIRCHLIRTGERTSRFVWTYHHLLLDGWSVPIVLGQVLSAYAALARGAHPELPAAKPFRDFIGWTQQQDPAKAESFWRTTLAGFDEPTLLAAAEPGGPTGFGESRWLLSPQLSRALREGARAAHVTLGTVVQSAWSVLLARRTQRPDVVFGITVAGRPEAIRGVESMVGMFINTLPLRLEITEQQAVGDYLSAVQARALGVRKHEWSSLADVTGWAPLPVGAKLFDHILVLENYPSVASPPAEVGFEVVGTRALERTNYPLTVVVGPGERIELKLIYDESAFDGEEIERLARQYRLVLEQMVGRPRGRVNELEITDEEERAWLVEGVNRTERGYEREASLVELVEEQVRRYPEAPAVRDGDETHDYRGLWRGSGLVAAHLGRLGIGRGDLVAVRMERGAALVTAVLGIVRAGAAYVPLDLAYPEERAVFMLQDAGARVLVTDREHRGEIAAPGVEELVLEPELDSPQEEAAPCDAVPGPLDLAYVTYTSGSTGAPKGIAVPHRAVVRLVRGTDYVDLGPDTRMGQGSNASFDALTFELWGALVNGGTLIVVPRDVLLEPERFAELVRRERISTMFLTTALFNQVSQQVPDAFATLDAVLFGGESVDPRWVARVLASGAPKRLLHVYGPTENTTFSSWYEVKEVSSGEQTVPIGLPLSNSTCYVLDERMQPVPVGVVGELHVGGDGLARGYWQRPEATAAAFVPDPFGEPGSRLYRTGDRVRRRADGALEFVGRTDTLIKLRGFRIEAGEIESELRVCDGVDDALVLVREAESASGSATRLLVAYVVAAQPLAVAELKDRLRQRLPEYMVPSAFVQMERLPLTPNGKVDRAALPAPEVGLEGGSQRSLAPVEEIVAGIWCEVLGLESVSVDDSFFELGGHSLLATQVVSRARQAVGVEVPIRTLFEAPSIEGFAAAIETLRRQQQHEEPALPLQRIDRDRPLPLSFAQQRLWFIEQMAPGNPAYHIPVALRLRGRLDVAALEDSFSELVRRHEALRTSFVSIDGEPQQSIHAPQPMPIPLLEADGDEALEQIIDEQVRLPFDLTEGPLLRLTLVRLANDDHVLVVVLHHIVADGWSMGVLGREIGALYAQRLRPEAEPALPELSLQYADFAVWQRAWLSGPVLERQLGYWKRQLADLPTLPLPTDRPRPALQSYRGGSVELHLDRELTERLVGLSRAEGCTLFMTLLAAYKALLARICSESDIVIGTPVANRNRTEIEGLIGFFVNMLVLRTDLAGDPSFRTLLHRVRDTALDAYAHQDLPFEMLVEALRPDRDPSRHPLFQVHFALHNASADSLLLDDIEIERALPQAAWVRFDLECHLWHEADRVHGFWVFNTDLFDRSTVERFSHHWQKLLAEAVRDADQPLSRLQLMTEVERRQQHERTAAVRRQAATRPLHRLFEERVDCAPTSTALTWDGVSMSYAELDRRANRIAHFLRQRGVRSERRVALLLDRSPALVAAILGVLKAGGAYVPLDPEYPAERIRYIVDDCNADWVLSEGSLAEEKGLGEGSNGERRILDLDKHAEELARAPDGRPDAGVLPHNAAYVIYTSGSTGKPKGTLISHANVARLLATTEDEFGFDASDVWTLFHSAAFDFSVWEIWGALAYGGRLVVVPFWVSRSPEAFRLLLSTESVTVLNQTPSAFYQLMRADDLSDGPLALRWVIFGGEALDLQRLLPWFERHGDERPCLVNMYGITETTVHVTLRRLTSEMAHGPSPSVIGHPIADLAGHVLDADLNPLPVGARGELFVAGDGLSRGYVGRAALTAERFLPDPFSAEPGRRMYRTGDLVRLGNDGDLQYLGRADHQVKVRGFRIELGEIEAELLSHPQVHDAIVTVRGEGDERELAAYVVHDIHTGDFAEQTPEWRAERVEQWQSLYDTTYRAGNGSFPRVVAEGSDIADAATGGASLGAETRGRPGERPEDEDFVGWNSSYDGEPIPVDQMRRWQQDVLSRLRALSPRHVLEIGCGSGLLMLPLAPDCHRYVATDFSAPAMERLRDIVARRGLDNVTLLEQRADEPLDPDLTGFDTVVLNSVVQYFPDLEYLEEVVDKAIERMPAGGAVFLGDIRSLPLLEALHASVQLNCADDDTPLETLRARVVARLAQEEELVIDPRWFALLARNHARVEATEIAVKGFDDDNELSKFRYDVVLRIAAVGAREHTRSESGAAESAAIGTVPAPATASEVREMLSRRTAAFCFRGLPNRRVATDFEAARLLRESTELATAGELRRYLRETRAGRSSLDVTEILAIGAELGYVGRGCFSVEKADGVDVVLEIASVGRAGAHAPLEAPDATAPPCAVPANDPLRQRLRDALVPRLRDALEQRLPSYMVPATFTLVDEIPLTAHGKVDRRALPAPDFGRPGLRQPYRPPATAIEERICALWAGLLDIDEVGVDDNFFELGGHSLLATQLLSRLRSELGTEVSLPEMFDTPTVASIARLVETRASASRENAEISGGPAEAVAGLPSVEPRGQATVTTAGGQNGDRQHLQERVEQMSDEDVERELRRLLDEGDP